MKYYKLIGNKNDWPSFEEGKIYPEDHKPRECTLGFHSERGFGIGDWQEVPESEYLLQEARERYPVGTKFRVVHCPELKYTVKSHELFEYTTVQNNGLHINFLIEEENDGASVYFNGKWAEIIQTPKTEQPQQLKIEVGGEYQTRDGRDVRIYAADGAGNMCVHGAVFERRGWNLQTWTIEGQAYSQMKSNFDLIPKPKKPLEFVEWQKLEYDFVRNKEGALAFYDQDLNEITKEYAQYLNNFKL